MKINKSNKHYLVNIYEYKRRGERGALACTGRGRLGDARARARAHVSACVWAHKNAVTTLPTGGKERPARGSSVWEGGIEGGREEWIGPWGAQERTPPSHSRLTPQASLPPPQPLAPHPAPPHPVPGAQDAGAHHRHVHRRAGQARVPHGHADARAAHPARQGHLEHLHRA